MFYISDSEAAILAILLKKQKVDSIRVLYRLLRKYLSPVFAEPAIRMGSRALEGRLMPDHVDMLHSIARKEVAQVLGLIKAKSAIDSV